MNRVVIIVMGVVLLVIVSIAGFLLLQRSKITSSSTDTSGTVFPGSDSTNGGGNGTTPLRTVSTSNGSAMAVKDFTTEEGVIQDPNVPDQYDLAGGAAPTSDTAYQIFYQKEDDYFGITLYHEPLGEVRHQAEQDLMNKLGIGQNQMCALNYVVAPGPGVNDAYAGQNLGFSFCPGAVKLP
ncbi:MAG: hypothetical protein ACM3TU_03930 [Bacillota bacterium]